jgi:hypothetical protein
MACPSELLSSQKSRTGIAPTMPPVALPYQTSSFGNFPLHESAEGQTMQRYRGRNAGMFPAKDTRNIPAFEITQGDYLKRVQAAMREHVGERPGGAKILALEIECSEKTTQSWLDGKATPRGILCSRAMARIPEYAALKRKLAAQEAALDPRVQQTIHELHRMSIELAGDYDR